MSDALYVYCKKHRKINRKDLCRDTCNDYESVVINFDDFYKELCIHGEYTNQSLRELETRLREYEIHNKGKIRKKDKRNN